jgi:hypothetical protein
MTKSYQQAEDEYFDRLGPEAQQLAPKPQHDPVNNPKHYLLFDKDYVHTVYNLKEGIEVRDVLYALVEKISPTNSPCTPLFESDYVQMMQYGMRFMDKGGVEDLKKMRWYLDKMIEAYDSNS